MPIENSPRRERSLAETIPFICQRPRMFVHNGTFHEVYTFLMGMNCGRADDSPFASEWTDFNDWLRQRKYFPQNQDCYDVLRDYSDDDAVVLQLLQRLFEQFANGKNS